MDSSLTSLVYWPGYREDDDENLALVWERRSGVTFDGRRLPGRAVGFVTGHWRQIPDEEWAAFEDSQMKLRAETLRRQPDEAPGRDPSSAHSHTPAPSRRWPLTGCLANGSIQLLSGFLADPRWGTTAVFARRRSRGEHRQPPFSVVMVKTSRAWIPVTLTAVSWCAALYAMRLERTSPSKSLCSLWLILRRCNRAAPQPLAG